MSAEWFDVEVVTKITHPVLFEAFEIISHDRGAGAGHSNYAVPREWVDRLQPTELALRGLSEPELKTFCIGEEEDQLALARTPELLYASDLLNSFFEDWDNPPVPVKEGDSSGIKIHTFLTTGIAYDASQTDLEIKDGDVLVATEEKVVGFLAKAWPVAVTAEHGHFHLPLVADSWAEMFPEKDYTKSAELAIAEARGRGY